jgi:hypothetical protein
LESVQLFELLGRRGVDLVNPSMSSDPIVGHPNTDHNVMGAATSRQPALEDECPLEAGRRLSVEHG